MFSLENPATAIEILYVSSSNLRRSYGGYDCEFVLCAVFKRLNSLLKPIKKGSLNRSIACVTTIFIPLSSE
jgi:hypothetical protein